MAAALEELRAVAGQIYPPLLHEAGFGPALRELVTARGPDVDLDVTADRPEPAVEGAVSFALVDCLESPPACSAATARRRRPAWAWPRTRAGGDRPLVSSAGRAAAR